MRITGKICKIYPQRSGVSQKTGNSYTVSEFHFAWQEGQLDANTHWGIVRCSTMQDLDMAKIQQAMERQTDIPVAMYFDVRESTKQQGTFFNEVRIYFPAEFLKETEVQVQKMQS